MTFQNMYAGILPGLIRAASSISTVKVHQWQAVDEMVFHGFLKEPNYSLELVPLIY